MQIIYLFAIRLVRSIVRSMFDGRGQCLVELRLFEGKLLHTKYSSCKQIKRRKRMLKYIFVNALVYQ